MVTYRFWNNMNEVVNVGGKYVHEAPDFDTAKENATALLGAAVKKGAVTCDIDCIDFAIIDD